VWRSVLAHGLKNLPKGATSCHTETKGRSVDLWTICLRQTGGLAVENASRFPPRTPLPTSSTDRHYPKYFLIQKIQGVRYLGLACRRLNPARDCPPKPHAPDPVAAPGEAPDASTPQAPQHPRLAQTQTPSRDSSSYRTRVRRASPQPQQTPLSPQPWHGELFHVKHLHSGRQRSQFIGRMFALHGHPDAVLGQRRR